jgi:hypothetical protein
MARATRSSRCAATFLLTFGLLLFYRWPTQTQLFEDIQPVVAHQRGSRSCVGSGLYYSFPAKARLLSGVDAASARSSCMARVEPLNQVYRDAGGYLLCPLT